MHTCVLYIYMHMYNLTYIYQHSEGMHIQVTCSTHRRHIDEYSFLSIYTIYKDRGVYIYIHMYAYMYLYTHICIYTYYMC